MLFHTFIDDLAEGVSNFADNTKLFKAVRKRTDCKELQKDFARLSDSTMKRQKKFCVGKRKVIGRGKIILASQ